MSRIQFRRFQFSVVFMTALALRAVANAAAPEPLPAAGEESRGSDVFVTPREALLRERPRFDGNIVGKLPAGSRLTLIAARERWLQVETTLAVPEGSARTGFISREVVAVFRPGEEGTRNLIVVGRAFSDNEGLRRLAAAFLLRASERLREAGSPDAAVEVALGETAEALAAAGGPFPPGLEIAPRVNATGGPTRHLYAGDAFRRALEILTSPESTEHPQMRERAMAGWLRARYPEPSLSLPVLWQETAAWLQLAESAQDPVALRAAADRLGRSSLLLGRYLLAAGKLEEMRRVTERVSAAAERVGAQLPKRPDGPRLASRAEVMRAMMGNGGAAFPQEARVKIGPVERVVRIEGKLGALALTVEKRAGGTAEPPRRRSAAPVLPVPGSLRVSPDGKSAAWIEVAGPTRLLPVMVSLESDEPAREIAFLSTGRPLRDRELAHVLSSLSGFSKDGQRLGLSTLAWNDTPGPEPRLSVVSVATGELLYETSKDVKSYRRLLQ